MMWTLMILSLGIAVWWGIGLLIGMHIGYKNGLELAQINGPDKPQIFDSENPLSPSGALTPNEIDEIDEWDDD